MMADVKDSDTAVLGLDNFVHFLGHDHFLSDGHCLEFGGSIRGVQHPRVLVRAITPPRFLETFHSTIKLLIEVIKPNYFSLHALWGLTLFLMQIGTLRAVRNLTYGAPSMIPSSDCTSFFDALEGTFADGAGAILLLLVAVCARE